MNAIHLSANVDVPDFSGSICTYFAYLLFIIALKNCIKNGSDATFYTCRNIVKVRHEGLMSMSSVLRSGLPTSVCHASHCCIRGTITHRSVGWCSSCEHVIFFPSCGFKFFTERKIKGVCQRPSCAYCKQPVVFCQSQYLVPKVVSCQSSSPILLPAIFFYLALASLYTLKMFSQNVNVCSENDSFSGRGYFFALCLSFLMFHFDCKKKEKKNHTSAKSLSLPQSTKNPRNTTS